MARSVGTETSKFSSDQLVKEGGSYSTELWIQTPISVGYYYSEEVNRVSFRPGTLEVTSNGITTVSDYSDFISKNSYGPDMKYPFVNLHESLMLWKDVRALLLKMISSNQ